jgi:hypothetical protein
MKRESALGLYLPLILCIFTGAAAISVLLLPLAIATHMHIRRVEAKRLQLGFRLRSGRAS